MSSSSSSRCCIGGSCLLQLVCRECGGVKAPPTAPRWRQQQLAHRRQIGGWCSCGFAPPQPATAEQHTRRRLLCSIACCNAATMAIAAMLSAATLTAAAVEVVQKVLGAGQVHSCGGVVLCPVYSKNVKSHNFAQLGSASPAQRIAVYCLGCIDEGLMRTQQRVRLCCAVLASAQAGCALCLCQCTFVVCRQWTWSSATSSGDMCEPACIALFAAGSCNFWACVRPSALR